MTDRIGLHEILKKYVKEGQCYFQPPESVKLSYPCIIYSLSSIDSKYADDKMYIGRKRYQVLYITKSPTDKTVDRIAEELTYVRFDRAYTSDGLNHYVFNVYY